MPTITPFLWYNTNGQEAVDFYKSVFKDSMTIINKSSFISSIEIFGQKINIMNMATDEKLNSTMSFLISISTQEEVDYYYNSLLTNGGKEQQCGWIKDQFGFCWQIVPVQLMTLMNDSDPVKAKRVKQAMFKMKKLIIADLEAAHKGE